MAGAAALLFVPAHAMAATGDAGAPLPAFPPIVREDPPVPSFLAPNRNSTDDYTVEWMGAPIPDVKISIEENSLQWARVDGVLRIPRGRVFVEAANVESGVVRAAGFTQPMSVDDDKAGNTKMLVPFVSGEMNPIEVHVVRGGMQLSGKMQLKFSPKVATPVVGERIYIDTTCSTYGVRFETAGGRDDEMMYVGCRFATAKSTHHRTSSLEIVVFWDNVGQEILVDGARTLSGGDSIWNLRVSSNPGQVKLTAGTHEVTLRYAVAEYPHKGSLGIGVGPYYDTFEGVGAKLDRETVEPVVTVYGSFAISPLSRITLFNATPVRADTYSDTGFYLQRRTSESLDRRVFGTVFLGGHFLAFQAEDFEGKKVFNYRFGAPQGVEFTIRDVPVPGFNVVAGGLTNPGIGGTAYYNVWLRWGNRYIFVELNYIGWQEVLLNEETNEERNVELRSIGISIGAPVFRFL